MRWAVEYSYMVEVEASTQFDASDIADEVLAEGFANGTIKIIDLFQHEPDQIPEREG
jgi:hypothetical protein